MILAFPLLAAFHGVEEVVPDDILDTQIHVRVVLCKLILNLPLKFYWSNLIKWSRGGAASDKLIAGGGV